MRAESEVFAISSHQIHPLKVNDREYVRQIDGAYVDANNNDSHTSNIIQAGAQSLMNIVHHSLIHIAIQFSIH